MVERIGSGTRMSAAPYDKVINAGGMRDVTYQILNNKIRSINRILEK